MNKHKFLLFAVMLIPLSLRAQLLVDCSGQNQSAYPSISAALANAGSGATILVNGTCNENVNLISVHDISVGAWFGQTANISGGILMDRSSGIYLYGLNVTNAGGDGIVASFSQAIVIDTCNSSGNAGYGLNAARTSDVIVAATGTFDNNSAGGIAAGGSSTIVLGAWAAPIDISNNGGPGVFASAALVGTVGQTIVNNNGSNGSFGGAGIVLLGGARAQWGAYLGPNSIQANWGGGVLAGEGSEASFFGYAGGPANVIQSNGPFGVQVGNGGQVTLFETAQVTDHVGPGLDVFGNGQVRIEGGNQILRNGTGGDPTSAGIRVDGNSEAYIRGGTVSQNNGPGILALVNSSTDFTGVTFSSNTGGVITCDSTATMISDLTRPNMSPPAGVNCKTPHALGNHKGAWRFTFKAPDVTPYKAMQAKYKKIATKH
ncbi:MAG TPA: right-handed parallel beta-helix repeat-containing protein [Candidatus Sulfotelmatobacter sp.]|nr:right-handed parallel beta-helix repeat-containing protein [Candidatus Sulfotelmatobacter sp.]